VQLALYTDVLERKALSAARRAFVWDVHGKEVPYDFTAPRGVRNPRTLWNDYEDYLAQARAIISSSHQARAGSNKACKFCHWYSACIDELVATRVKRRRP
jgi:predicted RecB family nuclease